MQFRIFSPWMLALIALTWSNKLTAAKPDPSSGLMQISIDARDLPRRKWVEAELRLPITVEEHSRNLALWYPKWVPGSHGPGGPVANVAGLQIRNGNGNLLNWKRTPGEVYRLEVEVPAGEDELRVSIRYLADQPSNTSMGHDCFGSRNIGVISPGCVLLYREGVNIDKQQIKLELRLPEKWRVASALPTDTEVSAAENTPVYDAVSLRTFVDSPIMFGRHYQTFDLGVESDLCPPHTLHVFADDETTAKLNPVVVAKYRSMVTQTALLIGSHPFDRFDLLLAVTDALPKNGLEHARSTLNVLPPKSLRSDKSLKGWDRLLIPHEYLHAWCGKYRRPAGMLTTDFHSAKDTELLWVYEGLTQYLGELIEARSGLMTADEFRHRLFVELRNATHQQGRQWRTLADTAAASHILRASSPSWSGLRRSQDYYMEGMLFWLEADAQIRRLTSGKKSLDDFCRNFFKSSRKAKMPEPFRRADIVKQLNALAAFKWDGLIARRIESFQQQFDPTVADLLGYKWRLTETKPAIPATTFRHSGSVDLLDSLGLSITSDGMVKRVRLGSAADRARLAPTVKIIGVNDRTWSGERLTEAVRQSSDRRPIDLLVTNGEHLLTLQVQYYDGLRYWNLMRDEQQPDLLTEILKAKEP